MNEQKKSQEIFKFVMGRQMKTLSFNSQINLVEERKWLLAVTSFGAMNCVFNITNQNKCFSVSTPGYWVSRGGVETINKLQKIFTVKI